MAALQSNRRVFANGGRTRFRRRATDYPAARWLASKRTTCVSILAGVLCLFITSSSLADAGLSEPTPGPPPTESIVSGRAVFVLKGCSRCHTVGGDQAENPIGPDLAAKAASWSDLMRFAGTLWNHLPEMTEQMKVLGLDRAPLFPEETRALTAYLFHAKFVGPPGNPERGRELFDQRLCSHCHQFAGRGGTVGPRLDELKDFQSVYFLARTLWNHGPEMASKMKELDLTPPRFEADDVTHIVAFLRGKPGPPGSLELAYSESGTPRLGEEVFREKGCIKCHAVGGIGGTVAADFARPSTNLTVSELAGAFWNHGAPMRAKMKELGISFPRFGDVEMSNLLAYLAFVQYAGPRGDSRRGGEIFREKGCSGCHAVGGEGTNVGPNLAGSEATRSVPHWVAAMWNHAPAMREKLRETGQAWPHFEDDEMRDVVEYLRASTARADASR